MTWPPPSGPGGPQPQWQHPWFQPPPPPRPSWTVPILAGAVVTVALHGIAVLRNEVWWPLCITCGCSGAPVGLLPAFLALRRDTSMGAGSGFAVAFIGVGLGALLCAAATIWRGFLVPEPVLVALEESWRQAGRTEDEIQQARDLMLEVGPVVPVFTAGLLALSGGITGAVVAALVGRRRPPGPPALPPGVPPPGPR